MISVSRSREGARAHPLIVQSHLRWDFVWQRPQQLMSRFARSAPVLFIEEPIFVDDVTRDRLEITNPSPGVLRAVPRLAAGEFESYDTAIERIRDLVLKELDSRGRLDGRFANAVQWFYTPLPAPAMLGAFNEIGVVYDCMDELSQFRNAHPDLPRRERLLLANADVVFTGGHKLYEAKSALHSNVHFFGCGVDADHFAAARSSTTIVPIDARFDPPVAGYFGVIDERLDYDLIARLAESLDGFEIVMVGPTAKVDPAELPRARNLHWLGQRSYDELPGYLKAFDVCLMPFALNEATEFINPTKTLEYMSAGKPIVSTAVPDVVRNFTPIVTVATDVTDFIECVQRAFESTDNTLIADGIEMARASSWDSIVERMERLISHAVEVEPIPLPVDIETSAAGSADSVELPRAS